jgi:hypothetical protein
VSTATAVVVGNFDEALGVQGDGSRYWASSCSRCWPLAVLAGYLIVRILGWYSPR